MPAKRKNFPNVDVVYAKSTHYLLDAPPGLPPGIPLQRGHAYAADDPVVQHRPDLFTEHQQVRGVGQGEVGGPRRSSVRIPRLPDDSAGKDGDDSGGDSGGDGE